MYCCRALAFFQSFSRDIERKSLMGPKVERVDFHSRCLRCIVVVVVVPLVADADTLLQLAHIQDKYAIFATSTHIQLYFLSMLLFSRSLQFDRSISAISEHSNNSNKNNSASNNNKF